MPRALHVSAFPHQYSSKYTCQHIYIRSSHHNTCCGPAGTVNVQSLRRVVCHTFPICLARIDRGFTETAPVSTLVNDVTPLTHPRLVHSRKKWSTTKARRTLEKQSYAYRLVPTSHFVLLKLLRKTLVKSATAPSHRWLCSLFLVTDYSILHTAHHPVLPYATAAVLKTSSRVSGVHEEL